MTLALNSVKLYISWSDIDALSKKVSQRIGVLRRVKHLLPVRGSLTLYNSLILPLFDYADIVWGDKNSEVLMHSPQALQNNAARTILDLPKYFSGTQALSQLNWTHLAERRPQHRRTAIYKCINKFILKSIPTGYNTRRRQDLHLARLCRAVESGGRGQIAPGPQVLGAPGNFLLGPSNFFGLNISAQRARYLFFWGKVPKFGRSRKNRGKVAGKQLQRPRPEKFSLKSC